ncbi:myosin phosphatase Rho-interacting protein-like isoform X1 [Hippoglossus hippoglossus]|uniref:myosin phosphatase Rho-interacting protein-like isoform X1 n=2 Tax=Hippoglossus hippoglossus TaxID=8267 RepID=UPI00148BA729|nr:myosin phosphatase Rho-interacting protein-like isoform X1 [Hippoglossus hippoglossus]
MAPPAEDHYCRQFQPNTFDPSRCSSCLRPDHMHLSSKAAAAAAPQQESPHESDTNDDDRAPSEETSASSDDVSGGWTYEWSLVHSLSPEWELNICVTDIQSSSPNQWDCPERSRSLSSERHRVAQRDMTRLDPSPHRAAEGTWMDERRGRDQSRRPSESRGFREQESGYFSPDRKGDGERQMEEVNKRPYRYYERGHPLPSNYTCEPKACVPYRNVNLGVPSQRRNTDTYIQEIWRSESPQRYTYHSNFRRGTDSERNSPTRHSSVSPDRYKLPESPVGPQRGSSLCRSQARSHASSQLPSHAPSLHPSGRSSPSRRRRSIASRTGSPPRAPPSHRSTDSFHLQNGDYEGPRGGSRESRSPSRASVKHSLDSEKLYRNLEFISRRGSSAIQQNSYEASQASPRTRTSMNSSANTRTRNSREVSPTRNMYGTHSPTPRREAHSRDSRQSPSQGSWQGSAHSLLSLPPSHGSSTLRRGADFQVLGSSGSHDAITETDKGSEGNNKVSTDRSRSNMRRGMEVLLISEPKKEAVETEEVGMTIDDYIVLADVPKIQLESEEEIPGLRRRNQSPSPCRDPSIRSYRDRDETDVYSSRLEPDERGRVRERGRDRREKCRDSENGRSSRRPSAASLHTQSSGHQSGKHRSSKPREEASPEHLQTQGWMSRLDEQGKWRKHWFVLGHTSLRFYRDSEAEELDDLDGEIDLTSCVNASDCDVQINYGLQIQTKRAVFTLSAVTSRIRRNWVKLLKQAIQNNTHQSDTGSEKENPSSRRPSSCQPLSRFTCKDSGYEPTTSTSTTAANSHQAEYNRRHQSVDGHLHSDLSLASHRGEGEGWDREQAKRLEERNRWFEEGVPFSEMGCRWESMELKKGSVPVPVIETMDSEVNRKWVEFETLSFRDMSPQSLIGAQASQSSPPQAPQSPVTTQTHESSLEEAEHSATGSQADLKSSKEAPSSLNGVQTIQTNTAEALQKEALSLQKQVESIKKERAAMGIEVDSPCGPGAPCRASLEAMEIAHRKALQELQEKHRREMMELEQQRDKMLQEESQAAAKAMEVLRAAHREEVDKARRSSAGAAHVDTSYRGHMPQAEVFHSELDVLSERYSQKCLELNRTELSSKSQETELGRKERELEQLRRENQELKAKLAEEISRMRYFITGQRSDTVSLGSAASDVEMLLRAKGNEVQYLKKEISCLQNEVQSLNKEKGAAYEHYKEAYVELSDTRGRSQLEMGSLNEHLRLANAALQEGARQT